MSELKPGARLRSAVCTTEVVVIAIPAGAIHVSCGGVPMLGEGEESAATATADAIAFGGTLLGKRYTNAAGNLELLCVKPGPGSLAAADEVLVVKGAKPLPSSD